MSTPVVHKDIIRKISELVILFGALYAIDSLLLDANAFSGVEPNPYWLPVLVLAMTYGTGMGLAAATIASLLWIAAPHQLPSGIDQLAEQHYLSLLPLLWTMAALLIGEVTASRRARFDRLIQSHEAMSADWEKVAEAFANLSKINRELQVHIASEEKIGGQAIVAAAGLVQPDLASQTESLTRLIALSILSDDFSYYQVRGDRIVVQLQGAAAKNRPVDVSQSALVQSMIKQPRILHAGQERSQSLLKGFGIAAIPVRDENSIALAAILVVHSSDKLQLNAAKLAEFSQIAQAIGWYYPILARPHAINLVDCDIAEGKVA
jgi:polysaccharide biosynthesis protein PelD